MKNCFTSEKYSYKFLKKFSLHRKKTLKKEKIFENMKRTSGLGTTT